MKRTILSNKYPIITTYNHHAHLLAILSNYEETLPWVYSNYIQLYISKDYDSYKRSDFYYPMPYESVPYDYCRWINYYKIKEKLVDSKWNNIIDFIIQNIDMNNYINPLINYKYIPGSFVYSVDDYIHDTLICGYDLSKKVFLCSDFAFKSLKYDFQEISFNCIEMAYKNKDRGSFYRDNDIYVFEYNKNYKYDYSIKNIYSCLKQYYNSVVPEYWTCYNNSELKEVTVGMDFYNEIINYLANLKDNQVDIRPFYLLYDHKKIMKERIEFLKQHTENLKLPVEILSYCDSLIEKCELIINLLIKYRIGANYKLVDKILGIIKEIYEIEKKELSLLLSCLEDVLI